MTDTMETKDVTIKPTNKDYRFYSDIFLKRLKKNEEQLNRMIRFTENNMERVITNDALYKQEKEYLEKYQDQLKRNQEKQTSSMDNTNEEFLKYVISQLELKEKQLVNNKKRKDLDKEKTKTQKDCMKKFYATESKVNRESRQSTRDINYFYERIKKIDSEMPQYMKDALDNMPSNKGYIYRGNWYFGRQKVRPELERKYLTMFERIKGIQYIHEYIREYPNKTYNVYEKLSKNSPKTLIRQTFLKDK